VDLAKLLEWKSPIQRIGWVIADQLIEAGQPDLADIRRRLLASRSA